jgi:hypothetical protein
MNKYITSSFSPNMINNHDLSEGIAYEFKEITEQEYGLFRKQAISYVGHQSTAKLFGLKLNRRSLVLNEDDEVVVLQLSGERLPEGKYLSENQIKAYKNKFKYVLARKKGD